MGERLRRRFRNTDRRIPSDLLSNRVDDRALTLESSPLYEPFTGLIADGFNGGPRAPWCSRLRFLSARSRRRRSEGENRRKPTNKRKGAVARSGL